MIDEDGAMMETWSIAKQFGRLVSEQGQDKAEEFLEKAIEELEKNQMERDINSCENRVRENEIAASINAEHNSNSYWQLYKSLSQEAQICASRIRSAYAEYQKRKSQ